MTRKLRASTFMLGCFSTKSPMNPAKPSIRIIERNIAMRMMGSWRARPTAVMTESSEKTTSMMAIWATIITKARCLAPSSFLVWPSRGSSDSRLPKISQVDLKIRKPPPMISTRSRPEMPWPATSMKGLVRPASQLSVSSSRMRVPRASTRPRRRPKVCCSLGSLPTRIDRKMTLSMPRTVSRIVSVKMLPMPDALRRGTSGMAAASRRGSTGMARVRSTVTRIFGLRH